jgi:hypothetical protein
MRSASDVASTQTAAEDFRSQFADPEESLMAAEVEFRPAMEGLVTAPSRLLAGGGGLVECENALCKSPGLIEGRGGLTATISSAAAGSGLVDTVYVREWYPYTWYATTDGTSTSVQADAAGAAMITVTSDELALRAEQFADRQCWTFKKALRMLDRRAPIAGTSLRRFLGAPRAPALLCQLQDRLLALRALTPDGGVAYRAVIVRHVATDAGDRIVLGAPSDRVVIWNRDPPFLSSNVAVSLNTSLLGIGDEIQIYRTPLVTTWPVDPGDEMVLVHSYRIQTLALSYLWIDYFPPNAIGGPALYTNDSQDGLIASNYHPRLASDVAYYNGMAFYAQASRGYGKQLTLTSIYFNGQTLGLYDASKTLFSYRGLVADTNIANAVLTNCAPTVTTLVASGILSVGQLVNLAANDPENATGPAYGRIVSWSAGANTITLDTQSTATVVGSTYIVWDWVGMETSTGTRHLIYAMPEQDLTALFGATSGVFYYKTPTNVLTLLRSYGGQDMERAFMAKHSGATGAYTGKRVPRLYTVADAEDPYAKDVGLWFGWDDSAYVRTSGTFEDVDFENGLFEVVSSKPFAFSQQVGATYAANLARAEQDGSVAGVAWSKQQQPESVPLLQYNIIGDATRPIVRVVATTDSLWIFKTDGLWRCYGDTPESLVFQQVDPTCRMPGFKYPNNPGYFDVSQWVKRLGNTVYAWTVAGIFAIDTAGVRRIDMAIEDDIRALGPGTAAGNLPTRAFGSAGVFDGIVVFGCKTTTYDTYGFLFAYHIESQTWSKWTTQLGTSITFDAFLMGSGDSDMGNLLLGGALSYVTYQDKAAEYSNRYITNTIMMSHADKFAGSIAATLIFTVTSVSGTTVTGTHATIAVMLPGMILTQSFGSGAAGAYMVMSVGSGTLVVDRAGLVAGAALIAYWPIKQTITYAATTSGAPAVSKFFARAYFGFERLRGGLLFRTRCRTRGVATPSAWATTYYPDTEVAATLPTSIGLTTDREFECMQDIPTEQAQGTGVEVTIELNQACTVSAIDNLTLTFKPLGEDVGGRS